MSSSNGYVMLGAVGLIWCAVFRQKYLRTAYRTIRESWKRAAPAAAEPRSGDLASLMNSPEARRLPPVVIFQMFVNASKKRYDECVHPRLERLDRALESIECLQRDWDKAHLALQYEINCLINAKIYQMNRGIGLASAATQTPKQAAKRQQQQPEEIEIETDDDVGIPSLDQAELLNKIKGFATAVYYDFLEPFYTCARLIGRTAMSHTERPAAMRAFVRRLVDRCDRIVRVSTYVDEDEETTEIEITLMPADDETPEEEE